MNELDQLTAARIAEFISRMAEYEIPAIPQTFFADAEALGQQGDCVLSGVPCVTLDNVVADGWFIAGEGPADAYLLTPAGMCYHLMQSPGLAIAAAKSALPLTPTVTLGIAADGDPDVIGRHREIHDALDDAADHLISRMADAEALDEIMSLAVERFVSKMHGLSLPPENQTFVCRLDPDDEILCDHYGDQTELAAYYIREPMPNVAATGWLVDLPHYPGEQRYADAAFVITDDGTVYPLVQPTELAGRHLSPEDVEPADPLEFVPLAERYLDDYARAQAAALLHGIDISLAFHEERCS
ncbi:hypothetical protein BH09ACT8_BH09ACT8_55450 [soil metagenome]